MTIGQMMLTSYEWRRLVSLSKCIDIACLLCQTYSTSFFFGLIPRLVRLHFVELFFFVFLWLKVKPRCPFNLCISPLLSLSLSLSLSIYLSIYLLSSPLLSLSPLSLSIYLSIYLFSLCCPSLSLSLSLSLPPGFSFPPSLFLHLTTMQVHGFLSKSLWQCCMGEVDPAVLGRREHLIEHSNKRAIHTLTFFMIASLIILKKYTFVGKQMGKKKKDGENWGRSWSFVKSVTSNVSPTGFTRGCLWLSR